MGRMCLGLKVELYAGTEIQTACNHMVALARRMDLTIEANFNDVLLMAHAGDDPDDIVLAYHEATKTGNVKVATSRQGQMVRQRTVPQSELTTEGD